MQINSNYSMNGVSYETRHKQNNIAQFSTECAVQKNENINPYMAEADFDEKAFDMIGPNTPRDVKDAWMEAAKDVNANGMGIKKNGMLSHISQMMVQRLNKQLKGDGDADNIDILGNTTESAIQATSQERYFFLTFCGQMLKYNMELLLLAFQLCLVYFKFHQENYNLQKNYQN